MADLNDLQNLIRGGLFLNVAMQQYDENSHPHVSLASQIAISLLNGALDKYEQTHGKEALNQFLQTIPELILEDGSGDETRGDAAAPSV